MTRGARGPRGPVALGLALGALALAGCLGAAPEGPADDPGPARAGAPGAGRPEAIATWSGRWAVSGAAELPAHFPETAPLVAPVWEGMRTFEVPEVPLVLEVAMDWTGAPGTRVQIMAEAPERDGEVHYWVAPGPDAFDTGGHLCARVPSDALVEGSWKVMPHSLVGADVSFTLTVRMVGGAGAFADGHVHWMTLREYLGHKARGSMQGHAAEGCAG